MRTVQFVSGCDKVKHQNYLSKINKRDQKFSLKKEHSDDLFKRPFDKVVSKVHSA